MSGKIVKAWHKFLQSNYNVFLRNATNIHKERKYEQIDVQKRFEEVEKERKNQRLALIEYKKKMKKKEIEEQLQFIKNHDIQFISDKNIQGELKLRQDIKNIEKYASFEEYFAEMSRFQKQELEAKIAESKQQQMESLKKIASNVDQEAIIKLESQLAKLNQDLEEIKNARKEIENIEEKLEDLEPTHILVSGMKKKLILNAVTYYEFQSRNLEGFIIHPETKKAIETVHYHVEHNLPIKRELLYEVVPELFDNEIAELEEEERDRILAKRPRVQTIEGSTLTVLEKDLVEVPKKRKKLHFYEELLKQEIDMREFVYKKAGEFVERHFEFLADKLEEGYAGTIEYLEHVEAKPLEKLNEDEKLLVEDLNSLRAINNDYAELIKLNKVRVYNKQRELFIPKFVENNKELKEAWVKKWEEIVLNSYDFAESVLLPEAPDEDLESKLDSALKNQQKIDIEDLIKQSQLEYQEKVAGDEPIRQSSRLNKDDSLVKRLGVLSKAMNEIPEDKKEPPKLNYYQADLAGEIPEEGRILMDELTKVLYLNNKDPRKFTLEYWATHFNIHPQKLRNIFNYVSYAIPDVTNESETGRIFRFIYDPSNAEPKTG